MNPLWKYGTERKATTAKRNTRQRGRDRALCREAVYRRERMKCQRCGVTTLHPRDCWQGDPKRAHVHEPEGRARVDFTKPENCQLLCGACHMPRGIHAPTVERMRAIQSRTKGR